MKFVKYFVIVWLIFAVIAFSIYSSFWLLGYLAGIVTTLYPPFGAVLITAVLITIVALPIATDVYIDNEM